MADSIKNKCLICSADRKKLIDVQFKEDNGKLSKVKVCVDCWKDLWDKLLKSKEVKIA
jgi:hypothetical protein